MGRQSQEVQVQLYTSGEKIANQTTNPYNSHLAPYPHQAMQWQIRPQGGAKHDSNDCTVRSSGPNNSVSQPDAIKHQTSCRRDKLATNWLLHAT